MRLKVLAVGLHTIALLAGCGARGGDAKNEKEDKMIRIDASVTPHAEILKRVKPVLEKKGYKVEIEEFTDYAKPGQALVDDKLDMNFFQYKPYLVDWAKEVNVSDKLTSVLAIRFEPLGIYSNNHISLKEIADGQRVSAPNNPTNGGRALKLLTGNGTITLKEGKGIGATKQDTETYNKEVEVIEIQAETYVTGLPDVDFIVVNRNSTLNAKINDKVLVTEPKDSEAAQTYANIIAVQTAHRDDEKTKDLVAVLDTEDVKKFTEERYNEIVVLLALVNE